MKYRRGIFRSLLSAVLAMAVALTSAPLTVHGEELKVSPEVSIRFKQGEKLPDRQGVPAILEAELSGGGAAEVSIRLDAAETGALRSSEDETKTLSDGAALGSGAGMTLRFAPDGSGSLDFTLDEDQTAAKAELWLLAAGEEQISFDITESDVTITASGESTETPGLNLTAETITVPAPVSVGEDGDPASEGEGGDPEDKTQTEGEEESGTDGEETSGADKDTEVPDGNGPAAGNLKLRSARAANVTDTHPASTEKIFWVDNNDESGKRPSADTYKQGITLSFSLDAGKTWNNLTPENMTDAYLDTFPQIGIKESGTTYEVQLPSLPKKVDDSGTEWEIQWRIDYPMPGDNPLGENYSVQKVTADNKDQYGVSAEGIYYIIREEFLFDIVLRTGGMQITEEMEQQLEEVLNKHIIFYIDGKQNSTLEDLMNGTNVRVEDWTDESYGENTAHMAVINLWRYDLNGNPVEFYMQSDVETMSPWAGTAGLTGDWIAVAYENSGVPNYGTVTDKVHNGGILYLTLEGNTSYTANKVWLDDGDAAGRPAGEFQLWRYREGEPYSSAAPVRDSQGDILSVELDASRDSYTFTFDRLNVTDTPGSLPEYDAEGHRYIYVAREYYDGSSNGYEMVFGSVSADGSVTDTLPAGMTQRESGNDFVYNGGTLSNRRTGNVSPKAVKRWKAAAFQSDFDDVTVELTLQRRVKPADGAADDGSGWTDVMENGQPVKKEMDGFRAETLTDTVSASVPGYDALGKELEYRWVETGVYQGDGDKTVNLYNPDDSTFTLVHDMDMALQGGNETVERQITYKSSVEMKDGESVITNRIANTVDYTIEKIWQDADGSVLTSPPAGARASFILYQSLSGQGLGTKVAEVTLDGTTDTAAAPVQGSPLTNLTFQETVEWTGVISGLPEFDEDGQPYEYMLVETLATAGSQPYYADSYTTYRDDTDYGYHTEVVNKPGEGNRIMVRKDWVDDGDVRHRSPVVVTAYRKDNDEALGSVTLENGLWYGWIAWDDDTLDPSGVYVLETEVGGDQIPLQTYDLDVGGDPSYEAKEPVLSNGTSTDHTYIQYKTDDHACEATYSVINAADQAGPGELCWVVTNRRLGNIDLTVTKSWVDGDGELRAQIAQHLADNDDIEIVPAVRLTFAAEDKAYAVSQRYTIGYTGVNDREDYVNIGGANVTILDENGDGVSSAQELDLSGAPGDTQTFRFYNLPKYDKYGKVIHYSVEEIWVVKGASGIVVDRNLIGTPGSPYYDKELWELICDYTNSITRNEYEVGDHHGGHDDHDKQSVEMTNALTGSKEIKWYKVWKDEYIYTQGKRPDIFLDIYQLTRDQDGKPEISVYKANYKWEYAGGGSDHQRFWAVTINGVPKYDQYGYEITYFAVEKTNVQSDDFDYTDVQYSLDGEELGDEYTPSGSLETDGGFVISDGSGGNGTAGPVYVMADISGGGDDPHYALTEGGTFTNTIRRSVVIEGRKIWGNLPDGYLEANLPSITFTLYQSVDSEPSVKVAELTVDDWESVKLGSSYVYGFEYAGTNELTVDDAQGVTITGEANAAKLQKYNESGQLYEYTVEETINWDENILYSLPGQLTIKPVNVFGTEYNGFRITNRYSPAANQGALTVKKLFEIPVDENGNPEAYPAVTFKLTRTYKDNEGNDTEDTRFSRTYVWSSEEVEQAYAGQSAAQQGSLVTHTLTWDALDIHAPNGSRYQYSVTEVKNNLNGYNTWIKKEDANTLADFDDSDLAGYGKDAVATGLIPHVNTGTGADVTFANSRNEDQGTIALKGTKIWDDIGNAFHSRPDEATFAGDYLDLYRSANAQPGENKGIAETPVPEDSYEIKAITGGDGDQYDYTITGMNGELEKYAPNGMPWRYTLKETLPADSPYQASRTSVTVSATDPTSIDETKTYAAITNSTTTVADFQKIWQDIDGNPLAGGADYLGADVSVTFKLQVTERNGDWTDAEKYFSEQLDDAEYQAFLKKAGAFEKTLTGRINARTGWSGSFTSLPQTIVKKNETADTALSYRVVESMIAYGKTKTDVAVTDKADGTYEYTYSDALFSPGAPDSGNPVNMLKTTEISVTKTWADDTGNKYGTRPESDRTDKVWQADFVIQRKTNGGEWENVKTYDGTSAKGSDLTVTLYGGTDASGVVEDRVTETVRGLPAASLDGEVYEYRARELQPGFNVADGSVSTQDIVADGGTYGLIYTAEYTDTAAGTEAVNTLETTDISARKIWIDKGDADRPNEITVALIMNGGSTPAAETQTSAAENWEYSFEKLPVRDRDGNEIEYSVVEKDVPDKYEVQYDRDYVIKNIHKGGLVVSKKVEGNAGETEREFHFKVILSDDTFNGSYNEMEFVDGVAEFTLKDGESRAVADVLSPGTTYRVEEAEADTDGYVTAVSGGDGVIDADMVARAAFTNTKAVTPPETDDPPSGGGQGGAVQTPGERVPDADSNLQKTPASEQITGAAKRGNTPQTGVTAPIMLAALLLILSGSACARICFMYRKKK